MMKGDGAAASETGDDKLSEGPCGETTWDWYSGTETGDARMILCRGATGGISGQGKRRTLTWRQV